MSSLTIALVVGMLIALSGAAGLALQWLLPGHHTAERSRDMIGGVVGLLTLLLALVLGLLIWTAYGVFSTQQTELQTIAARALEFDLEMRQYGPEGDKAREILRRDLVWAHEQFWGDEASRSEAYDASLKAMSDMSSYFDSLKAATPVPWPLVYAVTFWSAVMFAAMGLLSKLSPMSVAMLVLGSVSIGLAIFLILEFSKPYTGSIRVSPAPLEQAILALDQPGPEAAGPSK